MNVDLKFKKNRITINARGVKYDIISSHFERLPNSRLGRLNNLLETFEFLPSKINESLLNEICDDFDMNKLEFYFDRDPYVLNLILNYYSNGKLHIGMNCCALLICDELRYWQIDEKLINNCCEWKFADKIDEINKLINRESFILKSYFYKENFDNFSCPKLRENIWYLFERPSSSFLLEYKS